MGILADYVPFNPLDKENLGLSVGDALLGSDIHELPPQEKFVGAGLYCIYYIGEFPLYSKISEANRESLKVPLYIGKAVPKGARKGDLGLGEKPGTTLYDRLAHHSRSIKAAENLDIDDFRCRFLVVEDIWIALGEAVLIRRFLPIWNRVVEGFGIHDPGGGRRLQARSHWDTLHPGRTWALKSAERKDDLASLVQKIQEYEIPFEE